MSATAPPTCAPIGRRPSSRRAWRWRGGFHHPAVYIAEARRLGFAVRPPHVNHSGRRFTLTVNEDRPVLWMGLGAVKDLRREAIRTLVAGRPYADLRDLLNRVALQQKEMTI